MDLCRGGKDVHGRSTHRLRRYEHPHPGSLIHVDVTKFGNIPNGGGHRFVGRQQGDTNRAATDTTRRRGRVRGPLLGTAYVHTVIDDHSRMAYAEICADEKAATAIGVFRRATAWFADHGVAVERVLSDNGSAYKSHAWRDACAELGIKHKLGHHGGRGAEDEALVARVAVGAGGPGRRASGS